MTHKVTHGLASSKPLLVGGESAETVAKYKKKSSTFIPSMLRTTAETSQNNSSQRSLLDRVKNAKPTTAPAVKVENASSQPQDALIPQITVSDYIGLNPTRKITKASAKKADQKAEKQSNEKESNVTQAVQKTLTAKSAVETTKTRFWTKPETLCVIGAALAIKAAIVATAVYFGPAAVINTAVAFLAPGIQMLAALLIPLMVSVGLPIASFAFCAVALGYVAFKLLGKLKEMVVEHLGALPKAVVNGLLNGMNNLAKSATNFERTPEELVVAQTFNQRKAYKSNFERYVK